MKYFLLGFIFGIILCLIFCYDIFKLQEEEYEKIILSKNSFINYTFNKCFDTLKSFHNVTKEDILSITKTCERITEVKNCTIYYYEEVKNE